MPLYVYYTYVIYAIRGIAKKRCAESQDGTSSNRHGGKTEFSSRARRVNDSLVRFSRRKREFPFVRSPPRDATSRSFMPQGISACGMEIRERAQRSARICIHIFNLFPLFISRRKSTAGRAGRGNRDGGPPRGTRKSAAASIPLPSARDRVPLTDFFAY